MKIDIICVGKMKEQYLRDAMAEYTKRISRYADINILEVKDEKTPDRLSDNELDLILKQEGERILQNINDRAYVIALCVEGKQLSSEAFANELSNVNISGKSHIQFIIGGSLGIYDEIKKRADMRLGFSAMTFPHMLMRVILCEQIYRAFKINNHEPYHK